MKSKFALYMIDFCDLKQFNNRNTRCPIPNPVQQETPQEGVEGVQRNFESEKLITTIDKLTSEAKGDVGEYGFSETSVTTILTAIEELGHGEVKEMAENYLQSKEALIFASEPDERIEMWKVIFLELRNTLVDTYGSVEMSEDQESEYAHINHKDEIDTYKNEVSGCARPGTCCVKCDRLIDCPVPESICARVQEWNFETRQSLAQSEGKEVSDVGGFDPENITHTREPIPAEYRRVLKPGATTESKEKLREKDPEKYDYYEELYNRMESEKASEENPYNQRAEELELEESFPGILEYQRAAWDWLLDLKNKKIPVVDSEGNKVLRDGKETYYQFSDKEQNIYAPEIKALLQGKYPTPTQSEMIDYINKVKNRSRLFHSEKAKQMSAEEIFDEIAKLPGLGGLADNLRDFSKDESVTTSPSKGGVDG